MVNKGNFIGDGKGKMVVILALGGDDDNLLSYVLIL